MKDRKYLYVEFWADYFADIVEKVYNIKGEADDTLNTTKLYEKIEYLFFMTPKINFLNKNKMLSKFMTDYFNDDNSLKYKKIKTFYEYLCYCLCGIKKENKYMGSYRIS